MSPTRRIPGSPKRADIIEVRWARDVMGVSGHHDGRLVLIDKSYRGPLPASDSVWRARVTRVNKRLLLVDPIQPVRPSDSHQQDDDSPLHQ